MLMAGRSLSFAKRGPRSSAASSTAHRCLDVDARSCRAATAKSDRRLASLSTPPLRHIPICTETSRRRSFRPEAIRPKRSWRAVEDAKYDVEAAKAALQRIKDDLPDLKKAADAAEVVVTAAMNAILVPHIEALVSAIEELSKKLKPLRSALNGLFQEGRTTNNDYFAWERERKPGPGS
jgi:hypothetical protein